MVVTAKRTGKAVRRRPRERNRVRYAFDEFLTRPLATVAVWVLLAVSVILVDRNADQWAAPVHAAVATVVPPETTGVLLTTITPGLLTVVSIIFFVLIMAVQHQSTNYSPVVLDQFLRRSSNQFFFGTFVGLTVYCLLALTLVPLGQAVLAGALAMVLSSATFIMLLAFIYNAVDQVRPSSTAESLQRFALVARDRQQPLLARCRRRAELPDAPVTQAVASREGYVINIDGAYFVRALHRVTGEVEIDLEVAMGDHIIPGTVLAQIRGADSLERGVLVEAVLDAYKLGRTRDIGRDAAQAVDNLGSMAWTATAGSNDPEGARIAIEAMHGLMVAFEDQDRHHSPEDFGGRLPIVYSDRIVDQLLDGLTSVIVASSKSGQQQTCATVMVILCRALPNLSWRHQQVAVDRLQRVLPTAMNHVFTAEMEEAFDALHQALNSIEFYGSAKRVSELKTDLRQYSNLATHQTHQ